MWRWQTGTRPGVAVRDCRRFRPPAISCGGDQAPASRCTRGTRPEVVRSLRASTVAPRAPRPSSQPADSSGLGRRSALRGSVRAPSPNTPRRHAVVVAHERLLRRACRPGGNTEATPGRQTWRLQGLRPAAPLGARFRACLRWRHGAALEREVREAYGSCRQSGADHRGSSDPRRLAVPRRWRHRLDSTGHDRVLWRPARSRGSLQGFARAVDHEPRVLSDVMQPHGGDTVLEGARAPDEGFSRGLVSKVSAGFGSCRHHRVGACSGAAGPEPTGIVVRKRR